MKFFFSAFFVLTGLSAAYYVLDGPDSGAGIFALFSGGIATAVGAYNYWRYGSIFAEGPANKS